MRDGKQMTTTVTGLRLKALQARMVETGTTLAALAPGAHMHWVLGYHPHPDERPTYLLVGTEAAALVVPSVNAEDMRARCALPVEAWADADGPAAALAAALRQVAPKGVTRVSLDETMRADAALADLPFVLISSETRPQVLNPVRQSGACALLPKPFTPEQLAAALHSATDIIEPHEMLDIDMDLERLRVLLVDDSANARHFIRHVLGNLGIEQFIEASNGAQAVQVLADTTVDLVITDYNMPEMDGRALVEYIRQQSWQSSVPILMVTSESDMSRLAAVEQAGVSAICDKPFETQTIKRLIEQALAGRER